MPPPNGKDHGVAPVRYEGPNEGASCYRSKSARITLREQRFELQTVVMGVKSEFSEDNFDFNLDGHADVERDWLTRSSSAGSYGNRFDKVRAGVVRHDYLMPARS